MGAVYDFRRHSRLTLFRPAVLAGLMLALACGGDPGDEPVERTDSGAGGGQDSGLPGDAGRDDAGRAELDAAVVHDAGEDAGDGAEPDGSMPVRGPVNGVVLVGLMPVQGIVVIIDGVVTSTDAEGKFTIADVAETYQLTLVAEEAKFACVLDGATTRTPVVQMPGTAGNANSASVAGRLSGGVGFPNPAAHQSWVRFITDSGRQLTSISSSGTYSFDTRWAGAASQSGTLSALQLELGANGPVAYTGYAEKALTLSNAGVFGNIDGSVAATNLALSDVAERTVQGTIEVPATMSVAALELRIGLNTHALQVGAGSFSVVVPVGVSLPLAISVFASGGGATSGRSVAIPASGGLAIELAGPATPILPVEAASGVTTATVFSWTPPPADTVVYVAFSLGGWSLWRYTTASSTTIPDFSAQGIPLPSATSGTWTVYTEGVARNMDEVLVYEDRLFGSDVTLTEGISTSSGSRTFTTE